MKHAASIRRTSRRDFLKLAGALSAAQVAAPWALNLAALGEAAAATATDYKALVCVFLVGGNDNFNTLIPYDNTNYALYNAQRPAIAFAQSALASQVLKPTQALADGVQFALAPALSPLLPYFNGGPSTTGRAAVGKMAVMLNVGTLIEPIPSVTAYASAPLPPQLFSHLDQRAFYQADGPAGNATGWGGRIADVIDQHGANGGNSLFTCISPAGDSLFLTGNSSIAYALSPTGGAIAIKGVTAPLFGSAACQAAMRNLITATRTNLFENAYTQVVQRSIAGQATLAPMLPANTLTKFPAGNNLAAQLATVARAMVAGRSLGLTRQMFFVSLGNFDTHDALTTTQPPLLAQVADGMDAFYNETVALNLQNSVTAFTASDFGRTLNSNGTGSDHGWGSVHFAVGGAVNGGQYYGSPPALPPNLTTPGTLDVGRGRFIPTLAVDQFAGTLGTWFGVGNSDLLSVLPNLHNFATSANPTGSLAFMEPGTAPV